MTALAQDFDPGRIPLSGDAHGDGVGRLRVCNGVSNELREQRPEARRIGEHAQSRHLDVDDALEEKRLKSVEGSSNLSQEVDRRQAIRVHWPEATGRRQP